MIVAMDRQNRADLYDFFGAEDEKIVCLREYDDNADVMDVPDPYYGGSDGFIEVFDIIDRSLKKLLEDVRGKIGV
jgi:protein-tyrosine phosphatase